MEAKRKIAEHAERIAALENAVKQPKNTDYSRYEVMVLEGVWGGWKTTQFCNQGDFVCGMQARFEDWQRDGDDTALNGIKMVCCKANN
jgi:hypothetical protein